MIYNSYQDNRMNNNNAVNNRMNEQNYSINVTIMKINIS